MTETEIETQTVSSEFRTKAMDELASIKAHLVWLLMPTFLILLAVLGLTLFTWMEVSHLHLQIKSSEKAIDTLRTSTTKTVVVPIVEYRESPKE